MKNTRLKIIFCTLALAVCTSWASTNATAADKYAGYQELVAETHKNSLIARENCCRNAVKLDNYWIGGGWGETIWSLAALCANEKVDQANAKLLKGAKEFLDAYPAFEEATAKAEAEKNAPEDVAPVGKKATHKEFKRLKKKYNISKPEWPWNYFGVADYVRIVYMFGADSSLFPGRLNPETEKAMKEALWKKCKSETLTNYSLDKLLYLRGTENQFLSKPFVAYLAAAVLVKDPEFKDRKFDDGYSFAQFLEVATQSFEAGVAVNASGIVE